MSNTLIVPSLPLKKKITLKKTRHDHLCYVLRETFKLDKFRPKQEDIINDILDGHDILALLPTGSGKSLCYQLPALITTGLCIVISPLLALINDQLNFLNAIGIKSNYFNSQTNQAEKRELFNDLASDQPVCKLLYTTPETLISNVGLHLLLDELYKKNILRRIIIDEAHCVSNWGHEFRPSYLQLRKLKSTFPKIQIVTFTATATPKVQLDMIKQLNMRNVVIHCQSFVRPNLSYQIKLKTRSTVVLEMSRLIKTKYNNQCGIIYCLSRQDCEDVSGQLKGLGISSHHFHAGLSTEQKKNIQHKWQSNEIRVIVATIAFGLGINKPDVRFVFHHSMPKSIEGYYQETGRAGRDNLPSDCILFYSQQDKRKLEDLIKQQSSDAPSTNLSLIEAMSDFCKNKIDCRKMQMCLYLGEYIDFHCQETPCDNCQNQHKPIPTVLSNYSEKLKSVLASQDKFNREHLIKQFNKILPITSTDCARLINVLVVRGYLNLQTVMTGSKEIVEYYKSSNLNKLDKLELTLLDCNTITNFFQKKSLYDQLVEIRRSIADENKISPSQIFSDQVLLTLSQNKPQSLMELLQIPGIDTQKLTKYGDQFLTILIESNKK